MHGVGAGRLISNRYALNERRAHRGDVEMWSATDNTLGREVAVTVFSTGHPQAHAVLDAARRSSGLTDSRLIRVLDVGSKGDVSWLVEESLAESSSIAQLIARGPLPPEEARRIAGEVAGVLDVASRQGQHHLHITPHSVRRTDTGLVKVAGLSTAAAFEGGARPDNAQADRTDTVGVTAVMYAAMTGRWPLPAPVAGIEAAPRVAGGVVAPSELVSAVPPDLDAVCRSVLNENGAPYTPRDFVGRIGPWSSTPVDHVAPRARPTAQPTMAQRVERSAGGGATAAAGTLTRVAASHREHRERERATRAATVRARLEERRNDPGFFNIPEALELQRNQPLEPPAPLIPAVPQEEGRHAKFVLSVVGAVVLLALAVAVPTVQRAVSAPFSAPSSSPSGGPATKQFASPSASSTSSSPSTPAAPAQGGLQIESVRSFDPEGDDKENPGGVAKATDGDPATFWQSEGYKQQLGGSKGGVGLSLQLAEKSAVSKVILDLGPRPQSVTVYTSDSRSLDGAKEVGKLADVSGAQTVTIDPPSTDVAYVLVYVTQAAQQDDDKFRAIVSEVSVS